MTKRQKTVLLKHIKRRSLTRVELEKFCSGKDAFEHNCEIESLCSEHMICIVSRPMLKSGVFIPDSKDEFELSDAGKDYLSNIKKERIQFYLPIAISLAALIVSIISLLK